MFPVVLAVTSCLLLLEGATTAQSVTAWRPSSFKRDLPSTRNIPVSQDVDRATISGRDVYTDILKKRGVTGIQTLAYTQQSYNVLLSVGNILFEIALDTGSSDFWVVSDGCKTSQCQHTPMYPLKGYNSPSFSSINGNQTTFAVSFADGTAASGFVARETVRIGNIQSVDQAFGLVASSNLTLGASTSGVLGLGFPRLSRIGATIPNAPPFLSALATSGELAYPLFALSFTRSSSGTLSMGAVDASIVSNVSAISWHHVVPFAPLPGENATSTPLYLNWAMPLDSLTVNGTNITLHPTYPSVTGTSPLALLDAGNNGIYGPVQDVAAIFSAMGSVRQVSEGAWALPCATAAVITLTFSGTNVTLQPSDYLIGPTQGDPNLCLSWPMALPPSADGLDWHLGTPFLRTVYSVYSFGIAGKEPPLIGIYPLSNNSALTDTPASLSSAFSSLSATISTTVPLVLLPTPSYATSSYLFNTLATPLPTTGQITPTQSDFGASSYTPLFRQELVLGNVTGLPKVDPPPTLATLIITDASGVHTTTSRASSIPTASLGKPSVGSGTRLRLRNQNAWMVWMMVTGWAWTLLY